MTTKSGSFESSFVAPLLENSLLGRCTYQSLARLLPHISERTVKQGDSLYLAGDKADHFYVIRCGKVELTRDDQHPKVPINRVSGEECIVEVPHYLSTVVALTNVELLAIPRDDILALARANPKLRSDAFRCLTLPEISIVETTHQSAPVNNPGPRLKILCGWLATIVLPACTLVFAPGHGLNQNAILFLAVFLATVCMWIFSLMDEFVPGIFAIFAILILGIAPPSAVLSGFASDGFLLAMSILGLSTVIVSSGFGYRFLLWILLKLPAGERWENLGLFLKGVLLTPVVPSINGRVALLAPLVIDMVDTLKCHRGGPAATRLAITTFTGASLLSAVFLSSKSVNFVIFGMLPTQAQAQFQWLYWLTAGAMAGFVMLASYASLFLWMQRSHVPQGLNKQQVSAQLKLLGPLRNREWSAIVGISAFMLAVLTSGMHKIQPPWIALTILYALLVYGFLDKKEFNEKIDWPFLVYLAGIVGIVGAFNSVGLDEWLGNQLGGLGVFMRSNMPLFIVALAAVIFVIRLAVPISTTIVITAAVFVPLANAYGVNPWVVGFIILVLGEMWFFPYQCSYYIQFRDILAKSAIYDERQFLRINALLNLVKIAALYASLPYWHMLGLL